MSDWPEVTCGGWYERLGLRQIPPSLPCGGDDPQHYRDFHPEIALIHCKLHETWIRQIETCERLWSAGPA
jgi:hypothetical protein